MKPKIEPIFPPLIEKEEEKEMKQIKIECKSCEGTGLYKGASERGNCAVICSSCDGSGHTTFKYNDFAGRKDMKDVERVFKQTCGYVHTDVDVMTSSEEIIEFSKGGCTYKEWLSGATPKPVKDLYCPYLWDNIGIGNEPCSRCNDDDKCGRRINTCKHYSDKAACWKEYEEKINDLPC